MGGGGHEHHSPEVMPSADQDLEWLKARHIPVHLRDKCAHMLKPLELCRRETWFNPDRCTHERHSYEECQYIAWKDRVKAKQEMKAKEAAEAK